MVVDKISPADRFQVLALLKNIKLYLETCDISTPAIYDEPLVTINNLIYTIDDINIVQQATQGVERKRRLKAARAHKSLEISFEDAPTTVVR